MKHTVNDVLAVSTYQAVTEPKCNINKPKKLYAGGKLRISICLEKILSVVSQETDFGYCANQTL